MTGDKVFLGILLGTYEVDGNPVIVQTRDSCISCSPLGGGDHNTFDLAQEACVFCSYKVGGDEVFDEDHDSSIPAQMWYQDSSEGLILFIVFYTQACRWARCAGCNLHSLMSVYHVPPEAIMAQVDHVFSSITVLSRRNTIRKVIISNNGSVLDKVTFPTTALKYAVEQCRLHLSDLSVLALETRPEYVDWDEIEFLSEVLMEGDRTITLELCIGFEAFDDNIRNKVLNKGLTLEVFERFVEMIATNRFHLKCYFMQKPVPEMTDEQALADICAGIDYLAGIADKFGATINLHLNPTFVARGTTLEAAFRNGEFGPPQLSDVARAVQHAKHKSISLFVGLSDEGLAVDGGSFIRPGDEWILKRLMSFNVSQDFRFLDGI